MHWSQTESSKWSPQIAYPHDLGQPQPPRSAISNLAWGAGHFFPARTPLNESDLERKVESLVVYTKSLTVSINSTRYTVAVRQCVGYNRLLYSYFLASSHPENTHNKVKTATSKPSNGFDGLGRCQHQHQHSFPRSNEYMHAIRAPRSYPGAGST